MMQNFHLLARARMVCSPGKSVDHSPGLQRLSVACAVQGLSLGFVLLRVESLVEEGKIL